MKNRERTKHAIRIEAVDFRTLKGAFGRSKRALVGRVMIPTQDTPISSYPDSRIPVTRYPVTRYPGEPISLRGWPFERDWWRDGSGLPAPRRSG
jgi:hypothetical protein